MIIIHISIETLRKIPKVLIAIFLVLLVLNVIALSIGIITGHSSMKGLLDFFEFDKEQNLPTYFSSIVLVIASLLLFTLYIIKKNRNDEHTRFWLVLSLIFVYLSIDEFASIHELLTNITREIFVIESLHKIMWIIPGMIIALVIGIYLLPFYLKLTKRYKYLFAFSAILVLGGVFGVELLTHGFSLNEGNQAIYSVMSTLEETMEIMGVVLFIYSLIDYYILEVMTSKDS